MTQYLLSVIHNWDEMGDSRRKRCKRCSKHDAALALVENEAVKPHLVRRREQLPG